MSRRKLAVSVDAIEPVTCRAFVISDLHAFSSENSPDGKKNSPSYIDVSDVSSSVLEKPLECVDDLISKESIKAEMLICCGDLGDKASAAGIRFIWQALQKLKVKLEASQLFATVGNHDLDSRYKTSAYDPKELLQDLDPSFPLADEQHFDRFWSKHFTIVTDATKRVVLMNSCAFHGSLDEKEHGRISDKTIDNLTKKLMESDERALNILIVHHHPQKHSEFDLGEYDDMQNGQRLLDLLAGGRFGQWVVFHGHKHCPKLSYGAGGNGSASIFSVGSLGARLYPFLASHVRNQCYIVDFPIHEFSTFGLVGRFQAWDFIPGIGCQPAGKQSGLPHKGGFGARISIPQAVKSIAAAVGPKGRKSWSEIVSHYPEFRYLLPVDLRLLAYQLKKSCGIVCEMSEEGEIAEMEERT